jgi:hypothetical protein
MSNLTRENNRLLPARTLQLRDTHSILSMGAESPSKVLVLQLNDAISRLLIIDDDSADQMAVSAFHQLYEEEPFNTTVLTIAGEFLGAAIQTERDHVDALGTLLQQTSITNRMYMTSTWLFQATRNGMSMRIALSVIGQLVEKD